MIKERKPWTSFEKQIEILKSRGMTISDEKKAIRYLSNIGYYRLSGYWRPFQMINNNGTFNDQFVSNTDFKNVIDLYVFDKRLRILLLDAIERFEIALRVDVSHLLGKIDPLAYKNKAIFSNEFTKIPQQNTDKTNFDNWTDKNDGLLNRKIKSKSPFILHNMKKYGDDLNIWVLAEIWDFGAISMLFHGLKNEHKNSIAQKYGVSKGNAFASWVRSINVIRNICSHHDRLWNQPLTVMPRYHKAIKYLNPKDENVDYLRSRVFVIIYILKIIVKVINPNSTWSSRIRELLENFPSHDESTVKINRIGAPENWLDILNS